MEDEKKQINAENTETADNTDCDGEIKEYTPKQMAEFEEKSIKYDIISGDFERLKLIAQNKGCDVGTLIKSLEEQQENSRKDELLKKCSGDKALVEHIMELEKASADTDLNFKELKEQFPDINDISQLPKEVISASNERGSALLDEYLRYLRKKELAREKADLSSTLAQNSAVGSQANSQMSGYDPAKTEFIKGIWGK